MEKNAKMEAFASELKDTGAHLRLVNLANIHITLKFLGETREEHVPRIKEIMKEGARTIEPFKIELLGTGAFPNMNRIRVVWIGARNAEMLGKLASYLEDELEPLGYRKEKRGFSSHITVARVKSPKNIEPVRNLLRERRDELFGEQLIDKIRLKKSELTPKGPIYTVVEEAKFGGQ